MMNRTLTLTAFLLFGIPTVAAGLWLARKAGLLDG